ncbi:MAG TPA: hypothetical protein VJN64_12815 [Terriglobales bacterium]|nr:hypothetical protein [Terriglobales bacterium]
MLPSIGSDWHFDKTIASWFRGSNTLGNSCGMIANDRPDVGAEHEERDPHFIKILLVHDILVG